MIQKVYRTEKPVILDTVGTTRYRECTTGRSVADIDNNEYVVMGAYHKLDPIFHKAGEPVLDEDGYPTFDENNDPILYDGTEPVLDENGDPTYDRIPDGNLNKKISGEEIEQMLEAYKDVLTETETLPRLQELKFLIFPAMLEKYNSTYNSAWIKVS